MLPKCSPFILFIVLLVGFGCRPAPVSDAPVPTPAPLEAVIYEVSTGERLDPNTLYDRLAGHRFVIVGESHDDLWHHLVQERIYEGVVERADGVVALGMEMFQQPFQEHLDAYVRGDIDEETMLDATEWASRWGFEPDFYSPIWRLASERGYPVVALNIPRELVRKVAREGIESLDAEEAAQLPDMDLSNEAHRAYIKEVFLRHGMEGEEAMERFYQAQVLWDEAMAARAVEFMAERAGIETMVILAGRGHVERGWGIPSRIERRLGEAAEVVTVVPITIDAPHQESHRVLEYLQAEALADYVWVGAAD